MKQVYLNMRTSQGVETVDEFAKEETQSNRDFRAYVAKMVEEYQMAGMRVYRSSRSTKNWAAKD